MDRLCLQIALLLHLGHWLHISIAVIGRGQCHLPAQDSDPPVAEVSPENIMDGA